MVKSRTATTTTTLTKTEKYLQRVPIGLKIKWQKLQLPTDKWGYFVPSLEGLDGLDDKTSGFVYKGSMKI